MSSKSETEILSSQREINVIIFGESGTGKSALINQIHDKYVVQSSNQAIGCTIHNAKVSGTVTDYPHLSLNLYDTAGLSESTDGSLPTGPALVQLIKLAYAIPNGINLLICCHNKGRIANDRFQANYRIFKQELCENRIPCLLVITNCDGDKPLNEWWIENEQVVRNRLHFDFIDCVCVSTLRHAKNHSDKVREDYQISRHNLMKAIEEYALVTPVIIDSWKRKVMNYILSWYNGLIRKLSWLGFQERPLRPELEAMFKELKYTPTEVKRETEKLLKELDEKDLIAPYQEI